MSDQRNDPGDDVDELSDSDDSEPEEQPSKAPFDPDLDRDDDDDDDDDDDGEALVSAPAGQPSFSLRGGSSAFSDRSQSIFDCLDSVTQLTSSHNQDHVTDRDFVRPLPPYPSRKTIQPPSTGPTPPKKRGIPDYLVHPERWTHYSLEDVPETSDQDNSRAAHHFLFGLQQDRGCDSSLNVQQRMIFSRPNRFLKEQTADQLSAIRGKKRGMHLSHLEEEEEEVGAEAQGRKREKTGGRKTEQSEEDTEQREKEEERDIQRAGGRPEDEKRKRMQKEKGEEEKTDEVNPGFTSFRKTKSKNYRKSSEQEDN